MDSNVGREVGSARGAQTRRKMFLRIDKLQIELPRPEQADPESAGVVQELLGGKFGEMSTLMNYTYQSFNMRGKSKIRPYYDLVANIAAEELGHIELVANTVILLQDQTEASGEVPDLEPAALRPDRERRGYRGDRQEAVSRGEAG